MIKNVYIASGFFNEGQLGVVKALESYLPTKGCKVFSPRLGSMVGPGKKNTNEDKLKTYENNILGIDDSDTVVSVLDNKMDSGTIFEIGYAIKKSKKIVVITDVETDKKLAKNFFLDYPVMKIVVESLSDHPKIKHLLDIVVFGIVAVAIGYVPKTEHHDLRILTDYDTASDYLNRANLEYPYDLYILNMSGRKADPQLLVLLGSLVAQGKKVVVYADDAKSANLMLAYCTPYFCIGETELFETIFNVKEGSKSYRNTSDLNIV